MCSECCFSMKNICPLLVPSQAQSMVLSTAQLLIMLLIPNDYYEIISRERLPFIMITLNLVCNRVLYIVHLNLKSGFNAPGEIKNEILLHKHN